MTDWLKPEQQRAWRAIIALSMRLPAALDTQLQRDSDITHFEYFVLAVLSEAPERRLRHSELAERANASLSRLSHVVGKLEKRGLVERITITGTRGSTAVLTDAGHAKLVDAAPGHVDTVRTLLFDGLDDAQVAQLIPLGEAMIDQLDRTITPAESRRPPSAPEEPR
ncbi:MarR family winged helix-turn-helix transcriptional regulator [Antrihabitans cavernicola]|uniref:MarR family transcriptional regulator n=1 Tax=Antrihabitans cavernicola TaxID=2495913 RepID=A0A5A7S4E4_9NOCA|nr:MarR family transcriptional regulator [Spelaeibacter cavernicola]KAA0021048.1 MarR family transcriptional regulator [Spelaeibacter cavernicola]